MRPSLLPYAPLAGTPHCYCCLLGSSRPSHRRIALSKCLSLCRYVPVFDPNFAGGSEDEETQQMRSKTSAKGMMREMDSDGDGLISRAEFRAILTDAPELDSLANYDMRLMPAVEEVMSSSSEESTFRIA